MLEEVQFFIVVKYTNMYNKINVFNYFKYTVQCHWKYSHGYTAITTIHLQNFLMFSS